MRPFCFHCRKARVTCYCAQIRPFNPGPQFVILVHPKEAKNSVGTGRMLHRSLTNSLFLEGLDFDHHPRVNELLQDTAKHAVVLYPGSNALNLSTCTAEAARAALPQNKQLIIFLIDGTWASARGMLRRSALLRALPQLCFTPERPSAYEIREQPLAHCLSTLEAAHWLIDRFDQLGIFPASGQGEHHQLLKTFQYMVDQQLQYGLHGERRTQGLRLPTN